MWLGDFDMRCEALHDRWVTFVDAITLVQEVMMPSPEYAAERPCIGGIESCSLVLGRLTKR